MRVTPTTCAPSPPPRRSSPSRPPTPTTTSTCRRRRTGRSSSPCPADHRLRDDLQLTAVAIVGAALLVFADVRLGPGAVGRRRRRLRPADRRHARHGVGRQWLTRRSPRVDQRARRRCRAPRPRFDHRPVEQQDGDVAVPRLGVPAVRRVDLDVHALPRPQRRARARSDLRHPVHVGVELRAADVVVDDGARRLGDQPQRRAQRQGVAGRRRPLLGATFVGGQVYEFTTFYREGLGFTTSLFSSSFYTLTGFHGVARVGGHHHAAVTGADASLRPSDRRRGPRSSSWSASTGTSSTSCGSSSSPSST